MHGAYIKINTACLWKEVAVNCWNHTEQLRCW